MIPVTRPFLPPWEAVEARFREVYESAWLTNFGPQHQALEAALTEHAGVPSLLVANGTLALNLAARALALTGDVLTTPFTFVATSSALAWEGCTPRFVDIDPDTLNLDPDQLEAALTPDCTAIVATHVFGNPCALDRIQAFAEAYGLAVIYDAAHAIGVRHRGRSLFQAGDVATCSFQATKLFHTAEGGAVFVSDPELRERVRLLRDFGGRSAPEYVVPGINAKMSELNAAMGMAIWPYFAEVLAERQRQGEHYRRRLADHVRLQQIVPDTKYNHAYVPVQLRTEQELLRVIDALQAIDVHPRRYFHPCLTAVDWAPAAHTPVAEAVSSTVLCLPVFHELTAESIDDICDVIVDVVARQPVLA